MLQRCDIGDASRGSLSSYAYILMVLYFLQQRQPPVIPVLQEVAAQLCQSLPEPGPEPNTVMSVQIFDGTSMPQRMVDGWNAFFCDDLEDLVRARPRACCSSARWCERLLIMLTVSTQRCLLSKLQPNTETVGELWLGLLRFYTEEFDFKEHVISIRQKKRLTTFEKQWTSKCIAIEGATHTHPALVPCAPELYQHTSSPLTLGSFLQILLI